MGNYNGLCKLIVNGQYINGTDLEGVQFGFIPENGQKIVTGDYEVTGTLIQKRGVKRKQGEEPKEYSFLQVTGRAVPGRIGLVKDK